MSITPIEILSDYGLTLDHFYGLIKKSMGELSPNSYLQLQATAVPFDVSKNYIYFSLGNIAQFGDFTISPTPISDLLLSNPMARLSNEYFAFISQLLALVEIKELDAETQNLIDKYTTARLNLESHTNNLLQQRLLNWQIFADATLTPRGDLVKFQHWSDGQAISTEISQSLQQIARYQSLIIGLRTRRYNDPTHQQVVDAFAKFTSPASRTRYPRWDDRQYLEEQTKFSPYYFASLADNDSSLYANRQITTVLSSLDNIITTSLGGFTDTITKHSQSSENISTDWSTSGGGGWGPFSFKANAKSREQIIEDFSHTQAITVSTKSLQALPFDMSAWFDPGLFNHPLIAPNRNVFERFLGEKGTLLYLPTHIVIARGYNLKFHSDREWKHEYKSDFSTGGSGSAKFFGIGFGGSGNYSKNIHKQTVETNGHDLVFDDGDNIRLIGYNVIKNTAFLNNIMDYHRVSMEKAFFSLKSE